MKGTTRVRARIVALTWVGAGIVGLLGPAAQAAPSEQLSSKTTTQPVALRVVPVADYQSQFGAAGGVEQLRPIPANTISASTPSVDPPIAWHNVAWTFIDAEGRDPPVRHGDAAIGYVHYSTNHNITYSTPIQAAVDGQHPVLTSEPRVEYLSILTDQWGTQYARIRVINWDNPVTEDQAYVSPDGRPIGTITAYCEGVDRCPDEVNQQ